MQALSAARSSKLSSDKQMSLSPGDKLGPYEILALIGTGGMGDASRPVPRDVAMQFSREKFSKRCIEREMMRSGAAGAGIQTDIRKSNETTRIFLHGISPGSSGSRIWADA